MRYLRSLEGEQKPKKEYYLAKYLEFIRPFLKIGRESLDNSSCVYTVTEMNVEQVQRKTPMKKGVAKRAKAVYPKQEQAVDEYVEVETTKDDEIVYRDELEHSTGDNFQTTFTFPKGEKSSDRDDPLRNLAVVQAVRDIPQLYGREIGIAKEEMERLWNLVGSKADLSGLSWLAVLCLWLPLTHSLLVLLSRNRCSGSVAHRSRLVRALPARPGV